MDKYEFGLPPPSVVTGDGWNSWSAVKGRRRHAVRLSASVDSLPCATEADLFSSTGSFVNYSPEFEDEDGSVNNILDAFGERVNTTASGSLASSSGNGGRRSMTGAQSWSVLNSLPSPTLAVESNRNHKYPVPDPPLRKRPNPIIPPQRRDGDESSGVGTTETLSSISPTGSSSTTTTASSSSGNPPPVQPPPVQPPPLLKSQSVGGPLLPRGSSSFPCRASLRSWTKSISNQPSATMDKDLSNTVIPYLQQALALRYQEMLDTYLESPGWYRQHMRTGPELLDEICPVVYQVIVPLETCTTTIRLPNNPIILPSIYGSSQCTSTASSGIIETYQPISLYHIFAKPVGEDSSPRTAWLEGSPGTGKTIVCLKFVQEWICSQSFNFNDSSLNSQMSEFCLLIFIPIREVRGSLQRFISNELILKRSVLGKLKNGNLWRFCEKLSLPSRILIILDGIDDCLDDGILLEIQNVMNGLTFPTASVLLTSRSKMSWDDKRRFIVHGSDWAQIQSGIGKYFTGKKFGIETRLIQILAQQRPDLTILASNPLMLVLISLVFEEVGDIPGMDSEFYESLLKSLIHESGLIKNENSPSKSLIPSKWQRILEDLGRLTLGKLGERRSEYTEMEVIEACGSLDILKTGILIRSHSFFIKSNKKQPLMTLKILHPTLNVYLAANYLVTRINNPILLKKEITNLPGIEYLTEPNVQPSNLAYCVLQLVMEILQSKSIIIFNLLTLLDISINYLLALLRFSGFYETNLTGVCTILKSVKHVTIQVNSEWVSEWKQIISHTSCPFESVEIFIRPGYSLARLIEGLCMNETINSVKISGVPGQDWSHVDVNQVSAQLLCLLSEKKLKCLEISMTCLEDKEHSRFQGLIDVLCFILSRRVPLMKLVLDMDLTSLQIEELTTYIQEHETLDILHLPHLGCGPSGFRSIAQLLRLKSFLSLSLAGSWRSTHTDDELGLVVESLPPMSPFSLKQIPFSSLPRTVKSPSVRRKRNPVNSPVVLPIVQSPHPPLQSLEKRNSDSILFQRNFLPVPICDKENHEVDGFHGIFLVLRDPHNYSNLRSLNLSKCVMNWEDVICLGETIRKTKCLDSLRMEGMKLCDVLPILLGLQENVSLKLLDLSSPHVVIGDDALQLVSTSMSKNQTLRLLSIQGWTCYIEEERSLEMLDSWLRSSNVQDLDVTGVRVHINSTSRTKQRGSNKTDTLTSNSSTLSTNGQVYCKKELNTLDRIGTKKKSSIVTSGFGSILSLSSGNSTMITSGSENGFLPLPPLLAFLRIGGMSLEMSKMEIWKPLDLFLRLPQNYKLSHLDLSLDKGDSIYWIEDKILLRTFRCLTSNLPKLKTLILQNWKIKLISEKSTIKDIGKLLGSMTSLAEVNLDHSIVVASTDSSRRYDGLYACAFLSHLRLLSEFSWTGIHLTQLPILGNQIDNFISLDLTIKLDGIPLIALKCILEAKISSPTTTIIYVGNHSVLIRKLRDRSDSLMNKLRRLI